MRDRNASRRRTADTSADAGDDAECGRRRRRAPAPLPRRGRTPVDRRLSTARRAEPARARRNQPLVDAQLRHRDQRRLACPRPPTAPAAQAREFRARPARRAARLRPGPSASRGMQRQQTGIAGPGAHQPDAAGRRRSCQPSVGLQQGVGLGGHVAPRPRQAIRRSRSKASRSLHSGPNSAASRARSRAARPGLAPLVETVSSRSPRRTSATLWKSHSSGRSSTLTSTRSERADAASCCGGIGRAGRRSRAPAVPPNQSGQAREAAATPSGLLQTGRVGPRTATDPLRHQPGARETAEGPPARPATAIANAAGSSAIGTMTSGAIS